MKFYIIRHGKTALNDSGRTTGQIDIPITEEGVRQIEAVANELPHDIVALYSSDLLRTRQTTEILNKTLHVPVTYDPRLRERSFGSLEGEEWSKFDADGSLLEKDNKQKYDYKKFGGESVDEVRERIFACLKDIERKEGGKPVLIVAHGGVIRLLRHMQGDTAYEQVQNGSVYDFNFEL